MVLITEAATIKIRHILYIRNALHIRTVLHIRGKSTNLVPGRGLG